MAAFLKFLLSIIKKDKTGNLSLFFYHLNFFFPVLFINYTKELNSGMKLLYIEIGIPYLTTNEKESFFLSYIIILKLISFTRKFFNQLNSIMG
jgi:hypothetical protein